MKINKSLNIDLNIISPQKHIRIHEGDVESVDILIGVTVDDESVDLTGVTIKYDATINNYLAEQDANGSVVDNKISIPVTQNMTAMSGLLLIDVRMIQSDKILFTQTICATVEKAVVNGSTYIDFDKITIIQRMNALEEKMDYIEELVEDFDTSKLIVSTDRPPKGAPAEVDVDLLRVGDTWILSGVNIVYKLVEAQYNYQPVPDAEPYHKFIWQPLNERYGVGNTEPPATETYQPVSYSVSNVSWTWLPVPKYFKGDHYSKQSGSEIEHYSCDSGTMDDVGICTYLWHEEGGGDSIAIPTAEETAEWDDEIPTTYDGNGKKAVYWSGYLWVLSDVVEESYIWKMLPYDVSGGVTIIDSETSAEWDDTIPDTYAGNTGSVGEIAYYVNQATLWVLNDVDELLGTYSWEKIVLENDLLRKMDLASIRKSESFITNLKGGQVFVDANNQIGVKTLAAGIAGDVRAYDTQYIDTNFRKTYISEYRPPSVIEGSDAGMVVGELWLYVESSGNPYNRTYKLDSIERTGMYGAYRYFTWRPVSPLIHPALYDNIPQTESAVQRTYSINGHSYIAYEIPTYGIGDVLYKRENNEITEMAILQSASRTSGDWNYFWLSEYSKAKIDSMIGNIETLLSQV